MMGLSTSYTALSSRLLTSFGLTTSKISRQLQCRAAHNSNAAPEQQQQQQQQQRIPAEDNPFVKPLSNVYTVVPCRLCRGSGEVKCEICGGKGSLARGGFHKRNPVSIERIVGSNWTAIERTLGMHHFYVHSKRRGPGKEWFIEMVSACDETRRLWVNAKILKDREQWNAGWLLRGELRSVKDEMNPKEEAKAATICKACKGGRTQPCQMCAKQEDGVHRSRELDIIDV